MDTYLCKCIIFSDYRREFSDDDKKPNDHQSAAADSLLEINTNLNKETAMPPPHSAPPPSSTHFPSSSFRSTIDILKGKMTTTEVSILVLVIKQTCYLVMDHRDRTRRLCQKNIGNLSFKSNLEKHVVFSSFYHVSHSCFTENVLFWV